MAQEVKTSSQSSAALQAMAQSLRQAAQAPSVKAPPARPQQDRFASERPHSAPGPRALGYGMTEPTSPALTRAHISAAWQPAPGSAPSAFRDSPTGQAWQMTHFESVWQLLGPQPASVSISKARSFVAQRSKGVPSAELEAFIYDMSVGVERHQASLVRLINLGVSQGPMVHAYASLAQALCSELERTLSGVHEAVRGLFVQDLRKRAHLSVLKLPTRS